MSQAINEGGPAFPQHLAFNLNGEAVTAGMYFAEGPGMTLRDWFAGKAMQAFIIAGVDDCRTHDAKAAHFAYNLADAMILARTQPSIL